MKLTISLLTFILFILLNDSFAANYMRCNWNIKKNEVMLFKREYLFPFRESFERRKKNMWKKGFCVPLLGTQYTVTAYGYLSWLFSLVKHCMQNNIGTLICCFVDSKTGKCQIYLSVTHVIHIARKRLKSGNVQFSSFKF